MSLAAGDFPYKRKILNTAISHALRSTRGTQKHQCTAPRRTNPHTASEATPSSP